MKLFRKFGSHYAIERFGTIFLSLTLCMLILLMSIVTRKVRFDNQSLSGRAVYTSSVAMSLTESTGSVRGVYANEAHDKSFILFEFPDMSLLSTDANDYQFFLTGSDTNWNAMPLESHPNATFYIFGNTGYMGLYLYSVGGFPSQIVKLTVRSNNNFSGKTSAKTYADSSFNSYDQCQLLFNPGGAYARQVSFLDKVGGFTAFDVYEEIITRPSEKTVRTQLTNTLSDMHQQQLLMTEYANRLRTLNVMSPAVPLQIANDTVYGYVNATGDRVAWSSQHSYWLSSTTETLYPASVVSLYLDTAATVPRGYNFDWQSGSVLNGYLPVLTQSDDIAVWNKYLADHDKDVSRDGFTTNIKWYYSDGSEFTMLDVESASKVEGTGSSVSSIAQTITLLTASWEKYYQLKTEYQVELLPQLLRLERDAKNVQQSYTVNADVDGKLLLTY